MFIKKNKYYIYVENLRSINLDLIKTKNKFNLIYRNNLKKENIDVYVISMKNAQKDNSFYQVISDIKKKDSVKKVRLDVIYSDDKSKTPKVQRSCEIS